MIAGEVKGTGIVDVINYILTKGKSGILHVENKLLRGQIHISEWVVSGIITANAIGKDAFVEIYLSENLKFYFEETDKTTRNISISFKELIEDASQGTLRYTIDQTDIVRTSKNVLVDEIVDPQKKKILEKAQNGLFLFDLVSSMDIARAELIDMVCELTVDSALTVNKTENLKSFFMFPKNASMMLDEKERNIFRLIYSGMPVIDLISKAKLTPVQLADSLTWLMIKNTLTISDLSGKVTEPRKIRELLNLSKEDCITSLMAKSDRSFGSKPGHVKVDSLQVGFWQQALLGAKVVAVKLGSNDDSFFATFETSRNMFGRIAMHPNDMEKLVLFEGDDVICQPVEAEL